MSVLVPDLKVYNAVYNKAYNYLFHTVCDINYSYVFRGMETENKIQDFILDILWLNEMSYNQHYGENEEPMLHKFLEFKNEIPINTYQMLKYLECIKYNIEIETIKQGWIGRSEPMTVPDEKMHSYKLLCEAIEDIKSAIVNEIPAYKKAKWSN